MFSANYGLSNISMTCLGTLEKKVEVAEVLAPSSRASSSRASSSRAPSSRAPSSRASS